MESSDKELDQSRDLSESYVFLESEDNEDADNSIKAFLNNKEQPQQDSNSTTNSNLKQSTTLDKNNEGDAVDALNSEEQLQQDSNSTTLDKNNNDKDNIVSADVTATTTTVASPDDTKENEKFEHVGK